jgi:serine protease
MLFIIVSLACLINLTISQNNKYILTPKLKGKGPKLKGKLSKLMRNKIRGSARLKTSEFTFVQNLTTNEIAQLSNDFNIEKDAIASINWHLDRIDQRRLPLNNKIYKGNSSNLIDMYIVDTGVDISHPEFSENNAIWGGNFVNDGINNDCNGHGTHVASLALGKQYGSGKRANLIAVKVLGCNGSGSYSGIIAAIEWITNRASTSGKISIVNLSLIGPASLALDSAITSSFNSGVYYVVAAGNSNDIACNYSPARVPVAVTVAASDINDNKAFFSNFGTCIDVYSPGVNLLAAYPNGAYATLSGTSMASPVAAGVLANYLSKHGRAGYNNFYNTTSKSLIINNPRGTSNRLIFYSNKL